MLHIVHNTRDRCHARAATEQSYTSSSPCQKSTGTETEFTFLIIPLSTLRVHAAGVSRPPSDVSQRMHEITSSLKSVRSSQEEFTHIATTWSRDHKFPLTWRLSPRGGWRPLALEVPVTLLNSRPLNLKWLKDIILSIGHEVKKCGQLILNV